MMRAVSLLFCSYIDGFAYGHLLQHDVVGQQHWQQREDRDRVRTAEKIPAVAQHEPSDVVTAAQRGFVVYRETAQLMEALES
jgi:hypothetical protein